MVKNFRLNIAIRLTIMMLLMAFFIYYIFVDIHYLRSVYLAAFFVITIIEFFRYIDKTNRDFNSFLDALLQNDFTTRFSESQKGKSFNNLYNSFNKITDRFKQISTAREIEHIYLEAIVEHLRVGILSFDKQEKIQFMNKTLSHMLGKPPVAFLNNLSSVDSKLPAILRDLKPNENKLIKLNINNELVHLSFYASEFLLGNDYYKLISVQNIKNELDNTEMEAWQKLIRVLTHEIMNSVTPITSLSETLKVIAENARTEPKEIDKLAQGLDAINQRSAGLQNFTEAYKKLTKIPAPNFQEVNISKLINRVLLLFQSDIKNVDQVVNIDEELTFLVDSALIEQVFINLIKNALEAIKEIDTPTLCIRVIENDKLTILIEDNGIGITDDKLDQIFIPFFTTKEDGSGIGLALCRQIIRLHNGTISVNSTKGKTCFSISI